MATKRLLPDLDYSKSPHGRVTRFDDTFHLEIAPKVLSRQKRIFRPQLNWKPDYPVEVVWLAAKRPILVQAKLVAQARTCAVILVASQTTSQADSTYIAQNIWMCNTISRCAIFSFSFIYV